MASTALLALVGMWALSSAVARNIREIPSLLIDRDHVLRDMSRAGALAVSLPDIGGLGRRAGALDRRACGSNVLTTCPNDPTKCCPVGGQCCAGGLCCGPGMVCQVNYLGKTVCCPRVLDCTKLDSFVSTALSGYVFH
jgi:hypothetical protein